MHPSFSKNDLKNQFSLLAKNHPFLPDRKWVEENLDEKLDTSQDAPLSVDL